MSPGVSGHAARESIHDCQLFRSAVLPRVPHPKDRDARRSRLVGGDDLVVDLIVPLEAHVLVNLSGRGALPTVQFLPDAVVQLDAQGFCLDVQRLHGLARLGRSIEHLFELIDGQQIRRGLAGEHDRDGHHSPTFGKGSS
ncbi:hypothetical protein BN2475_980005 [Paraburkholderia ribeironis]|uniref:Uncharacterized protein n=1 Tax=Paraburkholderia ribeironis TaxID=1247936 RepID=A0A1N7SLQ2_9BURK|nr:hypothetical protein BN2475_980005 [Paraburkholderia ribeironis]